MAKSKRQKLVSLTKTTAKAGREHKERLVEEIRTWFPRYKYAYVIRVSDMRNAPLKELRTGLSGSSRLFFGRVRVMAKALNQISESKTSGDSSDGSADEGVERTGSGKKSSKSKSADPVASFMAALTGPTGLLLSNLEPAQLQQELAQYEASDFARSGTKAISTLVLPPGPVGPLCSSDSVDQFTTLSILPTTTTTTTTTAAAAAAAAGGGGLTSFPHSLEPQLRKLGMPTTLDCGVVKLTKQYTVCRAGEVLTTEQAHVLKHLGVKQATFRVHLEQCLNIKKRRAVSVKVAKTVISNDEEYVPMEM